MKHCKHLQVQDITPWHGDVFDHPDYKYVCNKDPQHPRELLWERSCSHCKEYEEGDDK